MRTLFDKIIDYNNIWIAWKKVENYTRYQDFPDDYGLSLFRYALEGNIHTIRKKLIVGEYDFQPVRYYFTAKRNNSLRLETVSSIFDRVFIQSIFNHVGYYIFQKKVIDEKICVAYKYMPPNYRWMYSYWKNDYQEWLRSIEGSGALGFKYCLHTDLRSYFHSIDRKRLLEIIANVLQEGRLINLVEKFFNYSFYDDSIIKKSINGLAIAEPLSRLMGNVYLAEFDRFVTKEQRWRYMRYMDDMLFFAYSEEECNEIKRIVSKYLNTELNLFINDDKTEVTKTEQLLDDKGKSFARKLSILEQKTAQVIAKDSNRNELLEALYRLLQGTDSEFANPAAKNRGQRFAAWRLAKLGEEESLEGIKKLLIDPSSRKIAAVSLAEIGSPTSGVILKAFLHENKDFIEDFECMYILKMILDKFPEHSDIVKEFENSNFWRVRSVVCQYYAARGVSLEGLLDKDPYVVRNTSLSCLDCFNIEEFKNIQEIWLSAFNQSQYGDSRLALLVLGEKINKHAEIQEWLLSLLNGKVSFEALYSLKTLRKSLSSTHYEVQDGEFFFLLDEHNWQKKSLKEYKKSLMKVHQKQKTSTIFQYIDFSVDKIIDEKVVSNVEKCRELISVLIVKSKNIDIKQKKIFSRYMQWTFVLTKRKEFSENFLKSAPRFIGFIAKGSVYAEISSNINGIISDWKRHKRSDDFITPTIIKKTYEQLSDQINRIKSKIIQKKYYSFEIDLFLHYFLEPWKISVESELQRAEYNKCYSIDASFFPALNYIIIKLQNNSSTNIEIQYIKIISGKNELWIRETPYLLSSWGNDTIKRNINRNLNPKSFVESCSKGFIQKRSIMKTKFTPCYYSVVQSLPIPLKRSYEIIFQSVDPIRQIDAIIYAFLQLQQLVAFILFSDAVIYGDEGAKDYVLRLIDDPKKSSNMSAELNLREKTSGGHWLQAIQELCKLNYVSRVDKLKMLIDGRDIQKIMNDIIAIRNRRFHGSPPPRPRREDTNQFYEVLDIYDKLLNKLDILKRYELFYLESISSPDFQEEFHGLEFNGVKSKATRKISTETAKRTSAFYIISPSDVAIPLWPFLVSKDENLENIYFFKSYDGKKVSYHDYESDADINYEINLKEVFIKMRNQLRR